MKTGYSYRIVANGAEVSEEKIAAALSKLGLLVSEHIFAPSLDDALSQLPSRYTGFAQQCNKYLRDCDSLPDSWAYMEDSVYFDIEKRIQSLREDSVAETSEKITAWLVSYMDLFEAQQLVRELILCVADYLSIMGASTERDASRTL